MYQRIGKMAFKKTLSNTLTLCKNLDNPQTRFKSIHIAGTNGKGSSAHMISAILQKAGYKIGLYTSPHLKDFTERISINGQSIAEKEVADFVEQNQGIISDINPSFFEVTVVMAFYYFARQKVDYAIIETGLGGRLDSTNIIIPEVSLITNIGMDHQDMLGESLSQIAGEKAGIIKPEVPVVIGYKQPGIIDVFVSKAADMNAPIIFANNEVTVRPSAGGSFKLISDNTFYPEHIRLDLKGDYQKMNLPGVLVTLRMIADGGIPLNHENIKEGLKNISKIAPIKGRWQVLSKSNPFVVCDIAHNEDGIKAVMDQLQKQQHDRMHIVWGMVQDKDILKLLKLLPKDAQYYFCEARIPRALEVEKLKVFADKTRLHGNTYSTVRSAIKEAKVNASAHDLIFIGGSTFVVAEIDDI